MSGFITKASSGDEPAIAVEFDSSTAQTFAARLTEPARTSTRSRGGPNLVRRG